MLNLIWLGVKRNVSIKRIVLVQLVVILFFLILMFSFEGYDASYREGQKVNVGIVNHDTSKPTMLLLNNFRSTEHFSNLYNMIDIKEGEIETKMSSSEVDAVITIPEGFALGLYHFENKPVFLKTEASNITKNAILRETLNGFSEYIKAVDMASYVYNDRIAELNLKSDQEYNRQLAFNLALLSSTLGREKYFDVRKVSEIPALSSFEYFLVALPMSFVAFISIMSGLRRLKEDASGIKVRLELSGLSVFSQLVAFYVSQILGLILLMAPVIAFAALKMGALYSIRLLIAFVFCYAFYSVIWRLIALISKNSAFLSVSAITLSFSFSLISGGIVPYTLLPAWAKYLCVRTLNFNLVRLVFTGEFVTVLLLYLMIFVLLFASDALLSSGGLRFAAVLD